jgi:hypothetical protein
MAPQNFTLGLVLPLMQSNASTKHKPENLHYKYKTTK